MTELRLTEKSVYSTRDYAALVLCAAKLKVYMEVISKVLEGLLDVDTMFFNLKPRNTLDDIEGVFKSFVSPLVEMLKPKLPHRRYTIAIDITHQLYYGWKPNGWVHAYKLVRGSTGCYKFTVVSIVSYSKRFVLLALPVLAVSKPLEAYVERLLDYVQELLPVEKNRIYALYSLMRAINISGAASYKIVGRRGGGCFEAATLEDHDSSRKKRKTAP